MVFIVIYKNVHKYVPVYLIKLHPGFDASHNPNVWWCAREFKSAEKPFEKSFVIKHFWFLSFVRLFLFHLCIPCYFTRLSFSSLSSVMRINHRPCWNVENFRDQLKMCGHSVPVSSFIFYTFIRTQYLIFADTVRDVESTSAGYIERFHFFFFFIFLVLFFCAHTK